MKIRIALICLTIVIAAQLIPVKRDNPPEISPLQAPAEVAAIIERSCYDCHSCRTEWPWYAYVAPVSWLVTHDVAEGRGHLDFSRWGELPVEKQRHAAGEIVDEVSEGGMPLAIYLRLHPGAAVSSAELGVLQHWARTYDAPE